MIRIVFTRVAYEKFMALDPKERRRFIRVLGHPRGFQKHKLAGESDGRGRIRYNRDLRIIYVLEYLDDLLTLIVLDFVNHDQMDRGQFNRRIDYENLIELDETVLEDDELLDDVVEELRVQGLWTHEELEMISKMTFSEPDDMRFEICFDPSDLDPSFMFTEEQWSLIEQGIQSQMRPSILLEGGAGSGKTSVAICQAMLQDRQTTRIGYVTYNSYLVDYTQKVAKELRKAGIPENIKTYDYISLCRQLLPDHETRFPYDSHITPALFHDYLSTKRSGITISKQEIPILWREIQQTIKGSIKAYLSPQHLISQDDYANSHLERSLTHSDIYRYAQLYQEHKLGIEGRWDELDLTIAVLEHLEHEPPDNGQWDILYCDEAQDFAEIQLFLLLRLTAYRPGEPPAFFLTGDQDQVLNPSGFSWKRIRTVLHHLNEWYQQRGYGSRWDYDSYHPERLGVNFRSQADIVHLGNKIRQVSSQQEPHHLVPLQAFLPPEGKPIVLHIDAERLLESHTIFGPRNAIIVPNETEKDRWVNQYTRSTTLIRTLMEMKGLEFEQVLVVDFFSSQRWGQTQQHHSQYLYNYLYVAATRARKRLIFIESGDISFWQQEELQSAVQIFSSPNECKEDIKSFFTEAKTREEYYQAARDYEDAGNYAQAEEAYRNGQYIKDSRRMAALIAQKMSAWMEAGRIWKEIEEWDKAIEAFRKVPNNPQALEGLADTYDQQENYDQAAQTWERIPNWRRAARSWEQLALLSSQPDHAYEKAALAYQGIPNWEKALEMWLSPSVPRLAEVAQACEQLGRYLEAAECYCQLDQHDKAIQLLKEKRFYSRAAEICADLGDYVQAAELCQQDNNTSAADHDHYWQKAAEQSYDNGHIEKARQYWQNISASQLLPITEDYLSDDSEAAQIKAAEILEIAGHYDRSEPIWNHCQRWERVARACEQQAKWADAARTWEHPDLGSQADLKPLDQAIRCWLKAAQILETQPQPDYESAANHYERAEHWSKAVECWLKADKSAEAARILETQPQPDYESAANHYERAEHWSKAAECWLKTSHEDRIRKAAYCYQKDQAFEQSASLWEQAEDLEKAIEDWQQVAPLKAAPLLKRLNRLIDAAKIWQSHEHWDPAASLYEQAYETTPDPSHLHAAIHCRIELKQWDLAARLYLRLGDPITAAQMWEEHDYSAEAAELYEEQGYIEDAVRCWEQAEDPLRAAHLLFNEQQWERAATDYEVAGDREQAAYCWTQVGHWVDAARCYRQAKKWECAARCWEKDDQPHEALLDWIEAGKLHHVARLHEALGHPEQAAPIWEELRDLNRAISNWSKVEDWYQVARLHEKQDNFAIAIQYYLRDEEQDWHAIKRCTENCTPVDWDDFAYACLQTEEHLQAGDAYLNAGKEYLAAHAYDVGGYPTKAAPLWEKLEEISKAKASWRKAEAWSELLRILEKDSSSASRLELADILEKHLEDPCRAAALYSRYDRPEDAARCAQQCGKKPDPEAREVKGEWSAAGDLWFSIPDYEKAGNAWFEAHRYEDATIGYERALLQVELSDPCPEPLLHPQRIQRPNWDSEFTSSGTPSFWGAVGLGAAILADAPMAALFGGVAAAYDATLGYRSRLELYEARQREIDQWGLKRTQKEEWFRSRIGICQLLTSQNGGSNG